jgi:rare lipoprotein A
MSRARLFSLLWLATVVGCAPVTSATVPDPPAETAGGEAHASRRARTRDDRRVLETYEGRASYYADSLAGRSTASGEPYDPALFTAASRELPFGTVLRVVRTDTGVSVIVRVNDRGPFGSRERILDLSGAAADALSMRRAGVVRIRAEVLEWGQGRHGQGHGRRR